MTLDLIPIGPHAHNVHDTLLTASVPLHGTSMPTSTGRTAIYELVESPGYLDHSDWCSHKPCPVSNVTHQVDLDETTFTLTSDAIISLASDFRLLSDMFFPDPPPIWQSGNLSAHPSAPTVLMRTCMMLSLDNHNPMSRDHSAHCSCSNPSMWISNFVNDIATVSSSLVPLVQRSVQPGFVNRQQLATTLPDMW